MKPNVVVNISNCVSGGGLQIALWFVRRLMEKPPAALRISYIINSRHVESLPQTSNEVLVVLASPMRSLAARRQINSWLAAQAPAAVLSLFGPSGFFHRNQVSGIANAFITSLSRELVRQAYPRIWPLHYLRYVVYGRMLVRSSELIFETSGERDKFTARTGFPQARTVVIGNSVHDVFLTAPLVEAPSIDGGVRLLFVTSMHVHKNTAMIPAYVAALKRAGLIKFVLALTLTADEFAPLLLAMGSDAQHIELLGKLGPEDLLLAYQRCHVVVQPSSLETYSAVYNETRFAGRALLASDRPFAREICESFAHFFEPLDADSFANAVVSLIPALPDAQRAAWEARDTVILPDEKFRQLVAVMERAAEPQSRRP